MKAAVIGTGFGAQVVAPVYQSIGIEVEVVSPRDTDAVKSACESPVDFVSVHSPPFLHRDHVLLAIANGHDVVCDKPFGLSAAESREMLEAATAAGAIHLLNFEFRHEEARQQIKTLIDEGVIGSPRHILWTRHSSGSRSMPYGWLFDKERGGGWIGAFGSHVIDTMRWWLGDVDGIQGLCRTDLRNRPDVDGFERECTAEDGFSACLTFVNGVTATIDTSFASAVDNPQEVQVFGSEGMLILRGVTDLTIRRSGQDDEQISFVPPTGDVHTSHFTRWATSVGDALREHRQIEPSFRDGLACAEIMDRLKAGI